MKTKILYSIVRNVAVPGVGMWEVIRDEMTWTGDGWRVDSRMSCGFFPTRTKARTAVKSLIVAADGAK